MLNLASFLLHLYIALFIVIGSHELSHLVTALAFRIKTTDFEIGLVSILEFCVRGTRVAIGILPITGGINTPEFDDDLDPELAKKYLLVFLAGSVVNLIMAVVIVVWSIAHGYVLGVVPKYCMIICGFSIVWNLVPWPGADGFQALRCLLMMEETS